MTRREFFELHGMRQKQKDAAKALGCHQRTIANMLDDGRLRAIVDESGHRWVDSESMFIYLYGPNKR